MPFRPLGAHCDDIGHDSRMMSSEIQCAQLHSELFRRRHSKRQLHSLFALGKHLYWTVFLLFLCVLLLLTSVINDDDDEYILLSKISISNKIQPTTDRTTSLVNQFLNDNQVFSTEKHYLYHLCSKLPGESKPKADIAHATNTTVLSLIYVLVTTHMTSTLQPRYNTPHYSIVSVIALTHNGPQFLATKCIITEVKLHSLNSSVYMNLMRFRLLSRESDSKYHAASNIGWLSRV